MSNLRERYFNITDPFELSIEKFNEEWAFVDNIWTKYNERKQATKW